MFQGKSHIFLIIKRDRLSIDLFGQSLFNEEDKRGRKRFNQRKLHPRDFFPHSLTFACSPHSHTYTHSQPHTLIHALSHTHALTLVSPSRFFSCVYRSIANLLSPEFLWSQFRYFLGK